MAVTPEWLRPMIEANLGVYTGSGDVYVIRHLTSETGLTLNGKRCRITGHNGTRLEVQLLDDPNSRHLLLPRNLLPEGEAFVPPPGPPLEDDMIVRQLHATLPHFAGAGNDRPDVRARVGYVRQFVNRGEVPPPSKCVDPMCPVDAAHPMLAVAAVVAPCCAGDQIVDFHRFASGTVGTGQECVVCTEVVAGNTPALGMPCGHVFHKECARRWLAEHDTCPTCRTELRVPGVRYAQMFADRDERVQRRLEEWFQSGMCDRCAARHIEGQSWAL